MIVIQLNYKNCYYSITNSGINSERKVLEIFIILEIIIQHPPCFFILEIIQNIFDLNLIPKLIFTILKTENFIDLGEINCEHWACRDYDSENGIALKKKELQNIVKTLNATFGLVIFEVNHSRKFMFCHIPLIKKSNTR